MRFKSNVGDVLLIFPAAVKLVAVAIVPKLILCEVTLDVTWVMSRAEVNGFTRSTVT